MTSNEELERQYTPSLFSKRFESREELLNYFLNFSNSKSQENRLKYDCHLNISYGPTQREKLDIYGDNLPPDSPLFIFIHGGYWQELDKDYSSFFVEPFIKNSIRVIVVEYELCPKVTVEDIVDQIQSCFKWISSYVHRNNVKRVSIAGHSVGAHLLAFALSREFMDEMKTVSIDAYFISGVYCLKELRNLNAANDGNILSITDENWHKLSPLYKGFSYLKNNQVDVYIYAGTDESDKFKEQSRMFSESSIKEFVKKLQFLDVDHFNIIENLASEDYEITRSIIDNLKK
ncbi:hypothetical protein ACKWTF_006489 [Chironomus riparius]